MSILFRYITAIWLKMYILCSAAFLSIYLVLDMIEKVPKFIKYGGAAKSIALFFLFKMPEMFSQTALFSVLMASILTFAALSKNSELIAIRSCGIGILKISSYFLFYGFAASIALMVNAEFIQPAAYQKMDRVERVEIKKNGEQSVFRRNNIWHKSENIILQAKMFEPELKELKGITIWNVDKNMQPIERIDAESAKNISGNWIVTKGEKKSFSQNSLSAIQNIKNFQIPVKLATEELKLLDNNADNLSFKRLREYSDSLEKSGYNADRFRTMMYSKIASPLGGIVMAIIAIPFGIKNRSRSGGGGAAIAISVAVGFSYFILNSIFISFGRSGAFPPFFAAFGGNVTFLILSLWLIAKAR